MGLLQKLKSTLGLGESRDRRGPDRTGDTGDTGVTVEHEPDASAEAAVKGTDEGAESETTETTDEVPSEDEPTEDEPTEDELAEDEPTEGELAEEETVDETETEESEAAEEESAADADATESAGADVPVDELSGIGPAYAERLGNAGVETVADLAGADAASLAEEADVPQGRVEDWIERANDY